MVKLTKIYTKTGDKGTTYLAGNHQTSKVSPRVIAYGTIDELNASLALVVALTAKNHAFQEIQTSLSRIQQELFDLGSQLAVLAENRRSDTPIIHQDNITKLEQEIDKMNETLPALNSFVIPGGSELSARLHLARTICRRAERDIVFLTQSEALDGTELPYINRLSDWLFVASRHACHLEGVEEVLWSQAR